MSWIKAIKATDEKGNTKLFPNKMAAKDELKDLSKWRLEIEYIWS